MNTETYLLAAQRLVPIQCVLQGHPVTSGLKSIDYTLGNQAAEPDNAQEHYTETLFLVPKGTGTSSRFSPPPLASKADFGWSEDTHIYLCPMLLFKIHPDFDTVIQQILAADSRAEIWFIKAQEQPLHSLLLKRFQTSIPEHWQRIHFLDRLPETRFYQALQTADVVLDSFGFGGGTTNKMVLGVGQPLLTCPGQFARSRFGLSSYHRIGLEDWVSPSPTAYVERALQLAQNKDLRKKCRQELINRQSLIFKQESTNYDLADFITEAVAHYPQKLIRPGVLQS